MQVFIIGTPIATARALDRKRLNKQIIECQQILDALNGEGLDVIGDDGIKKYATKSEVEYILSTVEALPNATHIKKEDCNFQGLTQETADRLLNILQEIAKYNKL